MLSIWETDSFYHPTDILIVGSGLTGLHTAIEIKTRNPNISVRIVERGLFPEGASVKNAGFACFGSLSEVLDDIDNIGETAALNRVEARYLGIQKLLSLVSPASIDYQQEHGFEVFTEKEADLFKRCETSIDSINSKLYKKLDFEPYSFVENSFGFNTSYPLLKILGEGALHSGKLVSELILKARLLGVIFNFGFDIKDIHPSGELWKVTNGIQSFVAAKVVIATNGFSAK